MTAPTIEVIVADITTLHVDAIVNAASKSLLGGGGVDGAIHRAAGPELVAECRGLHGCAIGDAKITKGYRLPARHVIHTVGPYWRGGQNGEPEQLNDCYCSAMRVARDAGLSSIAFPAISTGVFSYPPDKAARIAVDAILGFEEADSVTRVIFCCFSEESAAHHQRALERLS